MITNPPTGAIKFAAFSCIHCPHQDESALRMVRKEVGVFKPDILINLGDTLEADAASRWPSEEAHNLLDEYREADEVLRLLEEAAPEADRVWLLGNHDDNILREHRIPPKLRELCNFRVPIFDSKGQQVNQNMLKWKTPTPYEYSRRGVFRVGAVTFGHGYEATQQADANQAVILGAPFGLWVGGHTHRPTAGKPVRVMKNSIPLPYWYLNAGCLRKMDCSFMTRKRQYAWGHALVLGWALPIKSPRLRPTWDAECLVLSYYDDLLQ